MKKKKIFFGCLIFAVIIICGYIFFEYKDVLFNTKTFAQGTFINGINVSGMTKAQAQNIVATKMFNERNNIKITLNYEDQQFVWGGEDFEIDNGIMPYVENVYNYFNSGNIFEKKVKLKRINGNRNFSMPYSVILVGLDAKIDHLKQNFDIQPKDAQVVFDVTKNNPIVIEQEVIGKIIDKEELKLKIDQALAGASVVTVDVPIKIVEPKILKQDLAKNIVKRSSFFTDYHKSSVDRKFNIVHALENFNGMTVGVNQEVSFNEITGARSAENGYKKANIILNGVYVEGVGGGVCQASTTLYNALICANLEILEVHKHTLPSSYIELGFDAMVSEGVSDLKFKNDTNYPLYIKIVHDDKQVGVEIYGEKFEDGVSFKRRVEFVEVILHPGDRIVPDTEGKYLNKVTYKGEYLRLKYPHEGYRVKAYLDKYIDGVCVESKLLRDLTYVAQEGIIIEGTEEITEGITLPPNSVKFISPQINSGTNYDNFEKKISNDNPANFNP